MLALLGLVIGLVVGLFLNVDIPQTYSTYVAVGILAAADSIVGAMAANLQNKFDMPLFVTGLLGNGLIAVALAALGDQLGIPLYLAAVFAFGNRLFLNFSFIRRTWLERLRHPKGAPTDDVENKM